ncbi:hypothetical protein IID19_02730 [Patescibacteria group bacterium]|nr:hypothetical protein [Patescibacteria group bacterium]
MNNRGFVAPVIVVLISVMAIGLVGAAWYYEANKDEVVITTTTANTNTVVSSNTNTSSVDTSNWQTIVYNQREINFSIDLPLDWDEQFNRSNHYERDAFISYVLDFWDVREEYLIMRVSYFYNTDSDLKTWVDDHEIHLREGEQLHNRLQNLKLGEIEINGELGYVYDAEYYGLIGKTKHELYRIVSLQRNNIVYQIHIGGHAALFNESKYLIDQIIHTFQFFPDTSDWQTYTNAEWGISFNYPADWQAIDLPDPKAGIALSSSNYQPITSGAVTFDGEFYVNSISNPNNLSVEQLFDTFDDASVFWFEKFPYEKIDIGGNRAIKFPSLQDGTEYKRISVYIVGEKQVISFSYQYEGLSEFENIFDQILSTFQFLPDTSDWQTYENTDLEYSFSYPADWTISTTNGRVYVSGAAELNKFGAPGVRVYSKGNFYPDDSCLIDSTIVTIGTNEHTRQTEWCSYAGAEVATFIERGEGYVVVSWTTDYGNYYDTYEQILSTFKFLPDTSDWQTYTNEEYGYKIKYPNSYRIEEGDIYINIYSYQDNILAPSSSFPQDEIKIIVSIYQDIDLELASWIDNFNINITKEEPFLINGTSAIKVWGTTEQMGATFNDHKIFYITSGTGVIFTAMPINSDQLDIFYQIVETFQFID